MNIKKTIALAIVAAGILLVAAPARAFYLELPNVLKFWQGTTKAQDSGTIAPATPVAPPVVEPQLSPAPVAPLPPQGDVKVGESNPSPAPMPRPIETQPYVNQTCRVNGVDMPGSCEQYNNQPMQGGGGGGENNMGMGMGMQGGGENGDNRDNGDRDQKMQQQNQERQLKDMKRGVTDMTRNLKEFERAIKNITVSQEIKDKLQKAKEILDAAKNAKTVEEMGDMGELGDTISELNDYRQEVVENAQRMKNMKNGMKGMSTGLKQFEKQVANLTKKKIVVPTEITDNLTKLRTIMDAVNAAKTWEEAETAGIEDMQDLMQTVDEGRQQLEMLARWPQTLKQINNELKNLERQLKRDKTIVDRLIKKEIDLTANLGNFNDAITKLKAVRDDAVAKMAAGDSEGAFDAIENDFFGQMEDVWQFDRVIQTMNNLGQFKSDFKKRTAQADLMLKKLARAKKDVTEAKELLAELKAKGDEILEMIKAKEVDEEAVMSALSELEDVGQEFQNQMEELMGESMEMPWEQGPQQFKQVQMPTSVSRNLPQKTVEVKQAAQQPMNEMQQPKNEMVGESNPSPAP